MTTLTPLEDALEHMLAQVSPIAGREKVPLEQSLGRVLAQDLDAAEAIPPFDNSAMDGYAIHTDSLVNMPLPISQRVTAGSAPAPLKPGTAARIFTGAVIPPGANAVVMQEEAELRDGAVSFRDTVQPGQNIRPRGNDLEAGARLLSAGTRLRAQEMGLIASAGLPEIPVFPRVRVGIASTGDELAEPGQPLSPGQIYNTNRYTLMGLLEAMGCSTVDGGIIPDQPDRTAARLSSLARDCDLVITSGGVSVGEADHVRAAVEQLGALSLWRVAVKPGKPLAFGHLAGTPFLGLPGNPSAVLLTFFLFAAPLIRLRQGLTAPHPPRTQRVTAGFEIGRTSIRREFLRARLTAGPAGPRAEIHPNQSSGALSAACWADGLVVVPENQTIATGDLVDFLSFADLLYGQ